MCVFPLPRCLQYTTFIERNLSADDDKERYVKHVETSFHVVYCIVFIILLFSHNLRLPFALLQLIKLVHV